MDRNKRPSKKPGKGKKLPNKHAGITDSMADYALAHEGFPFHYEERLQQVFRLAAFIPIPALMGIRSANVQKTPIRTAPANAISPIRMRTGAGTVTRRSFILDIRSTGSARNGISVLLLTLI